MLADVIEHLVDSADLLMSVKGSLRPGGRVVASVPNVAHWSVRARLLFGRFDYKSSGIMDATHLRWFTRASLRRLFEASGYEVAEMSHTAGNWMAEYRKTPLRYMPGRIRIRLIWWLGKVFPGLFACQFIVSARSRSAGEPPG